MFIFQRTLDRALPVQTADLVSLGVECITIRDLLEEWEPDVDYDDGLIRI